jgi:hypothetical protein
VLDTDVEDRVVEGSVGRGVVLLELDGVSGLSVEERGYHDMPTWLAMLR